MRKAITPVISIIILLLITISLSGMGWTYMSGYYEAMTAKQIKVVEGSAYGNEVMILNIGTASIEESDLRILVDGVDAQILNMTPATVEPKKSAHVVFEFSGLDKSDVRIIGPGNAISYSHDIEVEELNGLMSWYKMDGNGNEAVGSNNGNVVGDVYPVSDRNGNRDGALNFTDGWQDYIDLGNPPSLDFTSENFSIEAWVYLTGPFTGDGTPYPGTNYHIFHKENYRVFGYTFRIEGHSHELYFRTSQQDAHQHTHSTPNIVPMNQWTHIVCVRDGPSVRFYMDGSDVTKASPPAHTNPSSSAAKNATISQETQSFHGTLDDVRIWNRALSENEVKALHSLS